MDELQGWLLAVQDEKGMAKQTAQQKFSAKRPILVGACFVQYAASGFRHEASRRGNRIANDSRNKHVGNGPFGLLSKEL